MQEKLLLSVEEVAELLSISRAKGYQLVHQDGFPTIRIGSCIKIYREALIQWIESQTNCN
jgi:excisionase family DNA binding protein